MLNVNDSLKAKQLNDQSKELMFECAEMTNSISFQVIVEIARYLCVIWNMLSVSGQTGQYRP